ncbi:conjugative transposon protein TraJ [Algoriphagus halophilus]|uniref:Bacteroides conjugative transposon TraJ protein n=1 Tax=Algoriphagus halophilus TaxID=226505 RepID=A0A1N6E6V5_9BACT|nr:conjugative transposon protein TraJ [Algoriphagus halophilus]SIN78760.1 Bacteroides conjugative transposon TraJ protein [Algoriphagus halophilus]
MKTKIRIFLLVAVGCSLSSISHAQTSMDQGLHGVLEELYSEMMPLCGQLISVSQGIAAFGALWYIGSRVWQSIANAEPIDFYPLFRPFAIGFCILFFPSVLSLINGVMNPTVRATASMMDHSNSAIENLLQHKEELVKGTLQGLMFRNNHRQGDYEKWLKYTQGLPEGSEETGMTWWESFSDIMEFHGAKWSFNFKHWIKEVLAEILQLLFEAAALCINTLRTFQLVVLSILGPLVFGLSVFDGFHHTLVVWLARYINIYLWLPVANIFGAIISTIQEKMLVLDIGQIEHTGDTFFSATDTGYLIFLVIGIIGYFSVPSVANYIVHAASGGTLPHKVSSFFTRGSLATVAVAGKGVGLMGKGTGMTADYLGDQAGKLIQSLSSHGTSSGYFSDHDNYQSDKLKGDS